jgi:phospholipid/cholesterol/gamma-HCH transport system ATP-binding protein
MIKVHNIKKSFGDQMILKGISTNFEAGKTSLIIGQSGSGKTVFLKSLLGVHEIDSGDISFDNRIYKELNKDGYIIPGLGDAGDRIFNTYNKNN